MRSALHFCFCLSEYDVTCFDESLMQTLGYERGDFAQLVYSRYSISDTFEDSTQSSVYFRMPCFVNKADVPGLIEVTVCTFSRLYDEVLHLLSSLGCIDLDFVFESLSDDLCNRKAGLFFHSWHLFVG